MTLNVDSAAVFAVKMLDTNGDPVTGLAHNAAGVDFSLYEKAQTSVTKTALTLAASGDNAWSESGDGFYTVHVTAAQLNVEGLAWASGKFTATVSAVEFPEEVIDSANPDKLHAFAGTLTAGGKITASTFDTDALSSAALASAAALEIAAAAQGEAIVHNGLARTVGLPTSAEVQLATDASVSDNVYNGMIAFIAAGTGRGQWLGITAYTGSSRIAALDGDWLVDWTVVPDTTSRIWVIAG